MLSCSRTKSLRYATSSATNTRNSALTCGVGCPESSRGREQHNLDFRNETSEQNAFSTIIEPYLVVVRADRTLTLHVTRCFERCRASLLLSCSGKALVGYTVQLRRQLYDHRETLDASAMHPGDHRFEDQHPFQLGRVPQHVILAG